MRAKARLSPLGARYDNRRTFVALTESGITCPPVDAALLATYFSYLERIGAVPAPGASTSNAAGGQAK